MLSKSKTLKYFINLAFESGFRKVIVASSCLSLIHKLKSTTEDGSDTGTDKDIEMSVNASASVSSIYISTI